MHSKDKSLEAWTQSCSPVWHRDFPFNKKNVYENFEVFNSRTFHLKNEIHFALLFPCLLLPFLTGAPYFSVSMGHFFPVKFKVIVFD